MFVQDDDEEEDDAVEEEVEDLLEVDQHIREAEAVAAEDEEAAAVQEQIRRIKAEEDEFETFDLKIVHRKNRFYFHHLSCTCSQCGQSTTLSVQSGLFNWIQPQVDMFPPMLLPP